MSRAEDIYTELSDSPISRASGLRDYAIQLEETVEQLQAKNAELREALIEIDISTESAYNKWLFKRDKAIASTDSSNWLAEQKAQWRREVLEEVAKWFEDNYSSGDVPAKYIRRMAEQPALKNPAGDY